MNSFFFIENVKKMTLKNFDPSESNERVNDDDASFAHSSTNLEKEISEGINRIILNQQILESIESIQIQKQQDSHEQHQQSQPLLNQTQWTRRRRCIFTFLYSVDIFLSVLLFSPLVSLYWNFTWQFFDSYFLVDSPRLSNFLCWFIGLVILLPSYLFQNDLHNFYNHLSRLGNSGQVVRILLRIFYIYLVSIGIVLEWRGVWNLIDIYYFKSWHSQLALAIVCVTFFCLSRSSRTLVSNPFILYRDDYENFFTTDSKHKLPVVSDYSQFSFDFFLAELVECLALVAAWRGIEIAYGDLVFADNKFYSLLTSFIFGHLVYFLFVLIQSFIFKLCSKNNLLLRLIAEDFLHIIMFVSVVIYWKFYWDLMEVYVFDKFEESLFYILIGGHFIAFFVAVSLKTSGLLGGPGVSFLDGEPEEDNPNSYYYIHYLSDIYRVIIFAKF